MLVNVLLIFSVSLTSVSAQGKNPCGVSAVATGFIVNGTDSERGEWPWIASLHNKKDNSFFCGGTLVAPNMVITVSAS